MDYSIVGLINSYNSYQEQYNSLPNDPNVPPPPPASGLFLGLELGIVLVALIIFIALWVVGLVLLLKYWRQLPDWAKVLGIIGLIPAVPGGPLLTIIVVLIGKNQK